jgi:hypothetical protein
VKRAGERWGKEPMIYPDFIRIYSNLIDRKTSEKHTYRQAIGLTQSELVSRKAKNAKEEDREGENSKGMGNKKMRGKAGRGEAISGQPWPP